MTSNETEQIEQLVNDAYLSAKALMDYIDKHPSKAKDLKAKLLLRFTNGVKLQLMKILF